MTADAQRTIVEQCEAAGLPILGVEDPTLGDGVVVKRGLLDRPLNALAEEHGYRLTPSGPRHTIVEEAPDART